MCLEKAMDLEKVMGIERVMGLEKVMGYLQETSVAVAHHGSLLTHAHTRACDRSGARAALAQSFSASVCGAPEFRLQGSGLKEFEGFSV